MGGQPRACGGPRRGRAVARRVSPRANARATIVQSSARWTSTVRAPPGAGAHRDDDGIARDGRSRLPDGGAGGAGGAVLDGRRGTGRGFLVDGASPRPGSIRTAPGERSASTAATSAAEVVEGPERRESARRPCVVGVAASSAPPAAASGAPPMADPVCVERRLLVVAVRRGVRGRAPTGRAARWRRPRRGPAARSSDGPRRGARTGGAGSAADRSVGAGLGEGGQRRGDAGLPRHGIGRRHRARARRGPAGAPRPGPGAPGRPRRGPPPRASWRRRGGRRRARRGRGRSSFGSGVVAIGRTSAVGGLVPGIEQLRQLRATAGDAGADGAGRDAEDHAISA